jgi:2-polyprenyl-6-methoxyphenol hydroxylase-like FAD-dependent oxidoreductase
MNVAIVGGGIGGLTLAIALEQKGIDATVYEAVSEFKKVGAGIMMANNAMQIYDRLGMAKAVEAAGYPIRKMFVGTNEEKRLSSMVLDDYAEEFKVESTAIHRAALHEVLQAQLEKTKIHFGKRFKEFKMSENQLEISFEDGTRVAADLLIAADGIHSKVRKQLFPNSEERSAYQLCWRGIAEMSLPQAYDQQINELWGKGRRFGFVQISENRSYWFAVASFKKQKEEILDIDLLDYYASFPQVVKDLIKNTPKDQMPINEIEDLKLMDQFYKGRVCLMGDAAHATTPNMGQGACQAIESAWVLADCLSKCEHYKEAFKRYQEIRKSRAQQIVKRSWMVGKLAHWSNPIARALRNSLMRISPAAVQQKQMRKIYELPM